MVVALEDDFPEVGGRNLPPTLQVISLRKRIYPTILSGEDFFKDQVVAVNIDIDLIEHRCVGEKDLELLFGVKRDDVTFGDRVLDPNGIIPSLPLTGHGTGLRLKGLGYEERHGIKLRLQDSPAT
jgi:hypothetical protein